MSGDVSVSSNETQRLNSENSPSPETVTSSSISQEGEKTVIESVVADKGTEGDKGQVAEAPKLKPRTKRYLDEQVREKHAALNRAAVAEAAYSALVRKLNEDRAKTPVTNDPMEIARQAGREAVAEAQLGLYESEAQTARQTAANAESAEWETKTAAARAKYPDFDNVAFREPKDGGPRITETMASVIKEIDSGADVAYYLGKNPREAHAIAMLPAVSQAIALAEIRDELTQNKPVAKVSSAPPPPETVKGSASNVATKDPGQMTMAEYAAWRKASKKKA